MYLFFVFFFKQKTAYEMRISDWSSDVCSSDLVGAPLDDADEELVAFLAEQPLVAGPAELSAEHPVLRQRRGVAHDQPRAGARLLGEIGRASGRERVCQYV